ncbi:hypothetical protein LAD77_29415 [Klebsiella pneumoniae]|nr:hypothetical protein [Klebsiella pneumoniae]
MANTSCSHCSHALLVPTALVWPPWPALHSAGWLLADSLHALFHLGLGGK